MKIIKINQKNMTSKEAIEIAKDTNGNRNGDYYVKEYHKTYYIVGYDGYANCYNHRYGNLYTKQFKIIFDPDSYKQYCMNSFLF